MFATLKFRFFNSDMGTQRAIMGDFNDPTLLEVPEHRNGFWTLQVESDDPLTVTELLQTHAGQMGENILWEFDECIAHQEESTDSVALNVWDT